MNDFPTKTSLKRKRQQGAISIEYAILFALFLSVFYAVIAYSIPLLLTLSFKHFSAEAARASLKVDPSSGYFETYEDYLGKVNEVINDVVINSWLPADWVSGGCPPPAENWTPLNSGYAYIDAEGATLDVCLQKKYDRENAIIPMLQIGDLALPILPERLVGRTTIRLQ